MKKLKLYTGTIWDAKLAHRLKGDTHSRIVDFLVSAHSWSEVLPIIGMQRRSDFSGRVIADPSTIDHAIALANPGVLLIAPEYGHIPYVLANPAQRLTLPSAIFEALAIRDTVLSIVTKHRSNSLALADAVALTITEQYILTEK